jgi:hypothetical protein
MRSYLDLSIRQKLQSIVMITSAVALLVASVAFTLYDRSTFIRAKTQDLNASAKMVGSNSTAALSFGDANRRNSSSNLADSRHLNEIFFDTL